MRLVFAILVSVMATSLFAQSWEVKDHPNNRKKAIIVDSIAISDYVHTEVSELAEGKAYVSQGNLYAYINVVGMELTPYVFVEANNFSNGFAIVGDSFSKSILNEKMQLVVPLEFQEVRLPKHGLIVVQSTSGTWGAYDTKGVVKLPLIYDLPPNILNLETIIVCKDKLYGVVNDCNEFRYNCRYQYIDPSGLGYQSGTYLRLF